MTIKELREKQAAVYGELQKLREKDTDDYQWSGEDEQAWARANEEYDSLASKIETEEARANRGERFKGIDLPSDNSGIGLDDRSGGSGNSNAEVTDETRMLAFQGWMRQQNGLDLEQRHEDACDLVGVNPRNSKLEVGLASQVSGGPAWSRDGRPMLESRNMNVGTPADGGHTVPEGFVSELEQTMLAFGGPRQVSRIIRTDSGNDLPWPTVDDTSNTGALLAEEGTIGSSVNPTFSNVTLKAYKYSSKPILISEELLQDSAFAMSQVINSLLGERLGRATATAYTTGTGSSQPTGIVTAASAGVTAASATAITADELIDLEHSVDPSYRSAPGVGFMLNDSTLKAIRKLKDGDGQYLWAPGLRSGAPDSILNRPYSINQDMATTVASAVSVLFGDFQKFVIRDVNSLRMYRLDERYRDNDLTGFVAFLRTDSKCIQTGAIKKLTQASS